MESFKNQIKISSNKNNQSLSVTNDCYEYYSNVAKNWAISDREIEDGKYSAKYYSNMAKNWAISNNTVENDYHSAKYYAEMARSTLSSLEASKQDVLTSGDGIKILNNVISCTQQPGIWGQISGNITQQTDLAAILNDKADKSAVIPTRIYDLGISTDPTGYNKVYSLKHSQFDISKVAVVDGSTITNGGVLLSGTVQGNYTPTIDKNFTIRLRIKTGSIFDDTYQTFLNVGGYANGLMVYTHNKAMSLRVNGSESAFIANVLSENNEFEFLIEFNASTNLFTLYKIVDGIKSLVVTKTLNSPSTFVLANPNIKIPYSDWSIDLKHFSITVEQEEVYNCLKTGLDTVKPDNYTVVGSPAITDNGVASGFDMNSYLNIPNVYSFTPTNKYCIEINFQLSSLPLSSTQIFRIAKDAYLGTFGFAVALSQTGTLILQTPTQKYYHPEINFNTWHTLKIASNNSNANIYFDGVLLDTLTLDVNIPTAYITLGRGSSNYFANGSIDLNAFKIYVDGNLVYQPCLKIPYTEAKTGGKIVEAQYRSRVEDCYKQFGTGNYYTIDEENKNFSLALPDIYGLIENNNILAKKLNYISRQVPNYSAGVDVSFPNQSTHYTVPFNGVFYTSFDLNNKYHIDLYVNGSPLGIKYSDFQGSGGNIDISFSVILNKGDEIYWNTDATSPTYYIGKLYPYKIVTEED